jgi:hypothetical protein
VWIHWARWRVAWLTVARAERRGGGRMRAVCATAFNSGEGTLWSPEVGDAPAAPGGGGKSEGWLDTMGGVVPVALTMKGKR